MVNLLQYIRTVLWSFIGLGNRANADALARTGNPLPLLLVAVVLVLVLIGTLVAAAHWAVRIAV